MEIEKAALAAHFCGAFKGLKIRCREAIRLSDMQSGDSGGGEKSLSMSQARALRRLVYAKRLNRNKRAGKEINQNELPPPSCGRRNEFSVRCVVRYDLSETHMVLLVSYL